MAKGGTFRLEWKGDALKEQLLDAVAEGLVAFGDAHEAAAKDNLAPGRGLATGTMQRSIHAAERSYDWRGDWPGRRSTSSPELEGIQYEPDRNGSELAIASGSGLYYADILERRWQFVQRAYESVASDLPRHIQDAVKKRGLT